MSNDGNLANRLYLYLVLVEYITLLKLNGLHDSMDH